MCILTQSTPIDRFHVLESSNIEGDVNISKRSMRTGTNTECLFMTWRTPCSPMVDKPYTHSRPTRANLAPRASALDVRCSANTGIVHDVSLVADSYGQRS